MVERNLLWQVLRESERTLRPGDDRDLQQGVGMLEEPAGDGVAGLVVSHGFTLLVCHHLLLLDATDHTLSSTFELLERYTFRVLSSSNDCSLVADVSNVGARETWSECSEFLGVFVARLIFVDLDLFEVYIKYFFSLVDGGKRDLNLTVHAAGSLQRWVQRVGQVGRSQHDD